MAEAGGQAQYMRVYRATNTAAREVERKGAAARAAALLRLAQRHRVEFAELLGEERQERGLPPVPVKGPSR